MSDDWETPRQAFADVLQGVPRCLKLYDPFYCAGRAQIYLEDLGFRVVAPIKNCDRTSNGTCDCQNRADTPDYDVLITNPPYSELEHAVPFLLSEKKPLYLLIPTKVATRQWFRDCIAGHDVRFFFPTKPYQYIHNGMQMNNCPFESVWVIIDPTHVPRSLKRSKAFAEWEQPDQKHAKTK